MYTIYMRKKEEDTYKNITELRKKLKEADKSLNVNDDIVFLRKEIHGKDYIITKHGKIYSCKNPGRKTTRGRYYEIGLTKNLRNSYVVTLSHKTDNGIISKKEIVHRLVFETFNNKNNKDISDIRIRHIVDKNDNSFHNLEPELKTITKSLQEYNSKYYELTRSKNKIGYYFFSNNISSLTKAESKEIFKQLRKNRFLLQNGDFSTRLLSTMKVTDLPKFAQNKFLQIKKTLEAFQPKEMYIAEYHLKLYSGYKKDLIYAKDISTLIATKIKRNNINTNKIKKPPYKDLETVSNHEKEALSSPITTYKDPSYTKN